MKLKNSYSLTLADVSAHRPVLYGFAALWILLYHMRSTVPDGGILLPLAVFQKLGSCGVDIFLLLTGFGLHASLERNPSVKTFCKKRFQRVLPASLMVILFFYGISGGGVLGYLARAAIFTYWLGVLNLWYVPFILTLYLLYPAIYRLQKRSPKSLWLLFALSLIPALLVCRFDNRWTAVCDLAVCRFPVFLLGCILAPAVKRGAAIPKWAEPVSLAASGVLLFATVKLPEQFLFFMLSMCYIFLSAFMIMVVTRIARFCTRGPVRRFAYRFMALCGGISLEIYLLFSRIRNMMMELPLYTSGKIGLLKLEILAAFLALVGSLLLSRLSRFIVDAFNSVRIPDSE